MFGMSDDEDDEVGEDPRISKLYSFAEKRCDDKDVYGKGSKFEDPDGSGFVGFLDELGTGDAKVLGGLWAGPADMCRAHFIVAALIDTDDMKLSACVESKRVALRAAVKAGGAGAGVCLLAALERYASNEAEDKEAAFKVWHKVLQCCWEREIVAEEDIRAWNEDVRAAGRLQVAPTDAQDLREKSLRFFEWLEAGE